MSFTSLQFLLFFPVVTGLYFALPHRARWLLLLTASCAFYMAFVPVYILILGFTIVVDYFAGLAIAPAQGRRRFLFLVASLVANIGVLAVFKYYNFAIFNVDWLLHAAGIQAALPLLTMALPIGLSFHTFQAMSYTIEVYRGRQEPERHFGYYALYVMFYPQLVAGPIERPQRLLPQLHAFHAFDGREATAGLLQMCWGFYKKTVIADRIAVGVNTVFHDPRGFNGPQLTLAAVLFTIQIYADFSGYSDIAIGAARVMGIRLVRNFDRPFTATNIAEFWRRWHISLYSWFSDYLFRPLLFRVRRWGKAGIAFAVLVTFSISGLWHGAAWTFVIWGLLHGVAVSLELLTRRKREALPAAAARVLRPLSVALTFAFVCVAFVFFRASTLADAFYIVSHLGAGVGEFVRTGMNVSTIELTVAALGFFRQDVMIAAAAIVLMFALESLQARYDLVSRLAARPTPVRWAAYYATLAVIVVFGAFNSTQPFIYFQF